MTLDSPDAGAHLFAMSDAISIRPATKADLAQIDAVLAASYPALLKPDYPPSILVTALPLISKANPRLITSGTYFVALDGERVVGAGGWTPGAPPGQRTYRGVGNIRHVVTDHREVRRGIGAAIMEEVLASAKAASVARLECLSTRTAVSFYASCGFKVVRNVIVPLRPGIDFPAVQMVCDVA